MALLDPAFSYRKTQDTSDSDSDSSDKDVWKRVTNNSQLVEEDDDDIEPKLMANNGDSQSMQDDTAQRKRKANTIWCTVLEDQQMSEVLKDCGLKKKPFDYGDRNCESYDYTLKKRLVKKENESDDHMSADNSTSGDENSRSSSSSRLKFFKKFKPGDNKFVKLDEEGQAAAKKIIKVLNEKKQYLIFRVVKILGIEKAMEFLKMTEDIEDAGGMMTLDNARKRTPGGVYLNLIKCDKSISHSKRNKIFEESYDAYRRWKIKENNSKKKKKKRKKKKPKEEKMEADQPSDAECKVPKAEISEMNESAEMDENLVVEVKDVPKLASNSDLEEGELDDD